MIWGEWWNRVHVRAELRGTLVCSCIFWLKMYLSTSIELSISNHETNTDLIQAVHRWTRARKVPRRAPTLPYISETEFETWFFRETITENNDGLMQTWVRHDQKNNLNEKTSDLSIRPRLNTLNVLHIPRPCFIAPHMSLHVIKQLSQRANERIVC